MIEILGSNEGREYEAALKLRELLLESWSWLENDPQSEVKIISGVQCHGQTPRDLDLVLLGRFSEQAVFRPFLEFYDKNGYKQTPEKVRVKDLCLVIEVKNHDLSGVRFIGTDLSVRYDKGWSDAARKNEKQKYSLKNYLVQNRVTAPFITNLIWLQNVRNSDLPSRPHNILGGNSSWELFLNVIMQLVSPSVRDDEYTIGTSTAYQGAIGQTINLLTRKIEPTNLDRQKMDRVCRSAIKPEWLAAVGSKQATFCGRGGTGKTVILLRLAWQLYEEQKARVLMLTYNKALVADLRRLFTLMNLSDDLGRNAVQIQTVYSFFYQALKNLEILSDESDFLGDYEKLIVEALKYLKSGAVTAEDVKNLVESNDAFAWNYVFIDEAQDWFEEERDLLRQLYPAKNLVVADGGDQLVRRSVSCNWQSSLAKDEREIFNLQKCLRMKAGLARFVSAFAQEMGVSWQAEPNADAPGGRILIIEGDYFEQPALHKELLEANKAAGNAPIDMLVCVPPSLVNKEDSGENTTSAVAKILIEQGEEVWDGVDDDTRTGYPVSINQLRIVQYEACRGLEGWTVINFGLDDFYRHKINLWKPTEANHEFFSDNLTQAHRFAARWVMIPLTRAIDMLVIQVSNEPSPLRDALKKAAALCPDSVTWKKI